ncbi:MAG: hypothetical protein HQM03_18680 [Magnetococcales bacterium]|nr:hypothetical protein [Magnetococcales bacterium]
MSEFGVNGLGAFQASLLNLRSPMQAVVSPLDEAQPGLPWRKTTQTNGFKPRPPEFDRLLQEILAPGREADAAPAEELEAAPTEPVAFLGQPATNPFFFNYLSQPLNGHYRTELARSAYNAMGRMGS